MFGISWLEIDTTATLVLTLATVIILYLVFGRGKRYNLPPGPTPLPFLGNILLFARSKKLFPFVLEELGNTYGPIFTVKIGFWNAVVLANYELAKEAFLTKSTVFAGRPRSYTGLLISEGGKSIVLSDFGPTWRLQRKIGWQAIRSYLTGNQLEQRIHEATQSGIDAMAAEKGPFNPRDFISMLIINFIGGFCYGNCYGYEDPGLKTVMNLTDSFVQKTANGVPEDFIPALKYLNLKSSREMRAVVKSLLDEFYIKYDEHKKNFDPDNIKDFTDCLIAAELEAATEEAPTELAKFTRTHFVQIMVDIYVAGVDTTRFTLTWAVLFMATNPEIQDKVFKEINDVVGTSRMPGMDDRKQLVYTEAALFESMRMGTVAPIGVPHVAMEDDTIGGYDIPKGTLVMVDFQKLHNDPKVWERPDEFRPERFLTPDGAHAPKPESFIPFSMGRRVCLGEAVAKPQLLLIFASLLQKFKFCIPPGDKVNMEPYGGLAGMVPHPYNVTVEARY